MGRVSSAIPKSVLAAIGDLITASAVGVPSRLALGLALQNLRVNAGATALEFAAASAGALSLLKANSGTDTTDAVGTNVDTFAVAGLTILDSLLIIVTMTSIGQTTTAPKLYHNTDGMNLLPFQNGSNLSATQVLGSLAIIRPGKDNVTSYNVQNHDSIGVTRSNGVGATSGLGFYAAGATAFTGSWTIALRHNGVNAGGTLHWSWAIYKVAGQ